MTFNKSFFQKNMIKLLSGKHGGIAMFSGIYFLGLCSCVGIYMTHETYKKDK